MTAPDADVLRPPPLGRLRLAALGLLTVVGWQLAFAPADVWPLGYLVLAPWGLAVIGARSDKGAAFISWLIGLTVWLAGLYWLTWITLVGYFPLVAYLSVYWVIAGWFVRRAHQQRRGLWWVLPVVWVALEYARAYVISGFPWFFLAHSQYRLTRLIQITDVTGQYGVSFFVAMVNGALLDALARSYACRASTGYSTVFRSAWRAGRTGVIASAVTAAVLLGYGTYRLAEAPDRTSPGARIGVVQCAFPNRLGGRTSSPERIFSDHLTQTRRLPAGELDLIVWPETVLPQQFDEPWQSRDPCRYVSPETTRQYADMQIQLARLLAEFDAPLLAGAITIRSSAYGLAEPNEPADLGNSVLLLSAADDGRLRTDAVYHKMHCVPFGEYVPFADSWPWLHRTLRKFVPEMMPQITPGKSIVRFRFGGAHRRWTAATPICYEGVFARVCRRMAHHRRGKAVDFLVNLSNDGWFIAPPPAEGWASGELDQHLATYVFRAIENRTPVVRAVNTGISGFIDSSGRIERLVRDEPTGLTKMITGVAHQRVLVDERRSVYSFVGDLAAQICSIALVVLGLILWLRHRRQAGGRGQV